MKTFGVRAFCAAWALVGNVASANEEAGAANPYAPIAARNVFGLLAPAPEPPAAPVVEPPPTIVVNGTMTIFGREQVLFKVLTRGNSLGVRAGEVGYVLAVGQQKDGVGVVKVDDEQGMVTFNNHGVVQEIALGDSSIFRSRGVLPDGNGGF